MTPSSTGVSQALDPGSVDLATLETLARDPDVAPEHLASLYARTDALAGARVLAQAERLSPLPHETHPVLIALLQIRMPPQDLIGHVRALVAVGAEPNATQRNTCALNEAIQVGDLPMVNALLELGADPNLAMPEWNPDGVTLLQRATSADVVPTRGMIPALVAAGALVRPLNRKGHSALMTAVINDRLDAVQDLLDAGATRHEDTARGESLLHLAVEHASPSMLQALLTAGLSPQATTRDGSTPLHLAVVALGKTLDLAPERERRRDLTALLLAAGAPVNARDHRWETPLHRAASLGRVTSGALDLLVDAGADLTLPYRDGTLPMARMAQRGSPSELAAVWARFERVQLQKSLDANATVLQNRARSRL